jgi:hypothetical protein
MVLRGLTHSLLSFLQPTGWLWNATFLESTLFCVGRSFNMQKWQRIEWKRAEDKLVFYFLDPPQSIQAA